MGAVAIDIYRISIYNISMIRNFRSKVAEHLFHGEASRHARKVPHELHGKVVRLLDQLNAATQVETLRVPPSNRLEKLGGDLNGHWSLRINKQWRITFEWDGADALNIDVVDYH